MNISLNQSARILSIIMLTCLPLLLIGQSISERAGGVTTNFIITSDSILLNDTQQILIKRGKYEYSTYTSSLSDSGYGYGYGYQSFHIEFTSNKEISTVIQSKRRKSRRRVHFSLRFTDNSGRVYENVEINESEINSLIGTKDSDKAYYYSINLASVPLLVLNEVSEINIIRVEK